PIWNTHLLIHLTEGLFNLHPKAQHYEEKEGKLTPVFSGSVQTQPYFEYAARIALADYLNDIKEGRVDLPNTSITPEEFFASQYEILVGMSDAMETAPDFVSKRYESFIHRPPVSYKPALQASRASGKTRENKEIIGLSPEKTWNYVPQT